MEYRPLLSENMVMLFGFGTLIPGKGFGDLYDSLSHKVDAMVSGFAQMTLKY
jgi:hypothetical protein